MLWNITARNCGPEPAELHLIPQAWFRNTWCWSAVAGERPVFTGVDDNTVEARHADLGAFILAADRSRRCCFAITKPIWITLFGVPNVEPFPKDAFHDRIIRGKVDATNPDRVGTKVGFWYHLKLPPGGSATVRVRMAAADAPAPTEDFDVTLNRRRVEADEFYGELHPRNANEEVWARSTSGMGRIDLEQAVLLL